jgi:hypothetical protein
VARTERTRFTQTSYGENATITRDARDDGCQHWTCNRWKRPDRRARRHTAKTLLRRDPDLLGDRDPRRVY